MGEPMISEAFYEIANMAQRMGVTRIDQMEGCWEVDVDDHWRLSVNGHGEPTKNRDGTEVPPITAYVEWNGWPAGLIHPAGGTMAAGSAANEGALIEALKAAATKETHDV